MAAEINCPVILKKRASFLAYQSPPWSSSLLPCLASLGSLLPLPSLLSPPSLLQAWREEGGRRGRKQSTTTQRPRRDGGFSGRGRGAPMASSSGSGPASPSRAAAAIGDLHSEERATLFCVSLGLAGKVRRVDGSSVGAGFFDRQKHCTRPISGFGYSVGVSLRHHFYSQQT